MRLGHHRNLESVISNPSSRIGHLESEINKSLPAWSPSQSEPLHAVVVRVDDRDGPLVIDGQGAGIVQLARRAPRSPPDAERLAVEGKLLDPMVAILADIQPA